MTDRNVAFGGFLEICHFLEAGELSLATIWQGGYATASLSSTVRRNWIIAVNWIWILHHSPLSSNNTFVYKTSQLAEVSGKQYLQATQWYYCDCDTVLYITGCAALYHRCSALTALTQVNYLTPCEIETLEPIAKNITVDVYVAYVRETKSYTFLANVQIKSYCDFIYLFMAPDDSEEVLRFTAVLFNH